MLELGLWLAGAVSAQACKQALHLGPVGVVLGGVIGAITGALIGSAAGGTLGAKAGQVVDNNILDNY